MGIRSISELKEAFAKNGVATLYVKPLAPNQDNEKTRSTSVRALMAS